MTGTSSRLRLPKICADGPFTLTATCGNLLGCGQPRASGLRPEARDRVVFTSLDQNDSTQDRAAGRAQPRQIDPRGRSRPASSRPSHATA